ncbi:MAG: VirB8/TrbF family protein [Elusimicrobiota bacterium]
MSKKVSADTGELKTGKPDKRKYFEVFGDTVNILNIFKKLSLLLVFLVIFQTVIIVRLINKAPLVIRVDSLGKAEAFDNAESEIRITKPEISNFVHHFLKYFLENNFYTYDDDFTAAFKMMSRKSQQELNTYLSANSIVENIKSNQLKSKLNITEIHIVNDSREYINLQVKGAREITSYSDSKYFREIIFENEISLMKVDRTESTPWGLLVDSWSESRFKE